MHQLFTVFVIVTMSYEHLALMVCPEDKYLVNGTSSCFCNGTNPRWEKEGDHYVNQIKHSNSSVEIVLVCNSNDSDLTFTCCVNDSETGLDVCNETFTSLFAYPVLTVNNKQYYNGSVVSLSSTSHHNLSCAIEEEFLSIDEVLLSCEGVLENRPVRSRDNVTLATIGCSTVCSCRAKQGTGCYQLASSVTFSVTNTDDEVILPLVIGLSVSIGLVSIAVFTAVIVLIIRSSTRRKRRASVRDRYSQDSANRQIRTKAYRLADTNCQVGIKSTDQEKDTTSSRLPGSGRSWSLPDLYMPGNTVTNRQYSRRQQIRPGHHSVSSDLADCNDDAIISAHLPHLLFDVTMDTTPELPVKLGKLKYGAKRESVYDTPPDRDFKISENLNEKISEVKNRNVQNKHFTEERLSELVACQVLTTDPGNQIEIPSEHPTVCTQLQIPSQHPTVCTQLQIPSEHPTVCTQLQIPLEQPTDQYDKQLEQATSLNNQSEIPSEHPLSLCDQHEISLEKLTSLLEIFPIEQHPVRQNQQEKNISMELPIILSSEPLEAPDNVKPGTKVSIITDYTNEDLTNSGYENIVINK
ncbi:uncharacterized protein LOC106064267 isoform X3 [Biomphalaria glabrata]|uniref:Uncharacterized protein LOC106064267 isoform X3 n=1 Tax=Biomphalaria glabrata TaxID=6526 RepID=A0A9W3ARZ0_BIOGL|nr:uncharacterized protein LOC106064267 isoform X3 [Biomphalaria glabrata]